MTNDEKIERIAEDVSSIKKLLNGNGKPEDGIVMRLDRIEQREIHRAKHEDWRMRAFWTSVFSAVAASIVAIFGWIRH